MRISDWSTDVCSSDLDPGHGADGRRASAGLPLRAALPLRHPDLQQSGAGAANARPRSCRRLHPRTARDIRRGGGIMTVTPDIILETRSEEHTSELQSTMRSSYSVFCFKKQTPT